MRNPNLPTPVRLLVSGLFVAFGSLAAGLAHALQIDGRIGADEWRAARHITDFRRTQPLTGEPASLPTEAWVMATPEGLAVAVRNVQPPSVPRTLQHVQRDFEDLVDRVNVIVDFDGDGRTGYAFRLSCTGAIYDGLVTKEGSSNKDWDGNWRHAVYQDEESWSVEILIPWHTAPMREANGATRTLKFYVDRVVAATGERVAWPMASTERPRYLSEFAPLEVANYQQSLLAISPYASGLYDNVRGRSTFDAGFDLFWKPNGQTQLTAAVNPDFGQVESDDLVVNFDATEVFVSDKRPFFTENQGLFEFNTPSDFSQLLYTRRIGAPSDDGRGAADITAALKLNGSLGAAKYGLFAADEADEAGRTFGAARLVRDFEHQNMGLMATYVDRPFLDRRATVLGVDHDWRPTARWNVRTRVFGSDIAQSVEHVRGTGATLWADYEMDHGWRQQWIGMHFGKDLQINDAGYLERNSLNYLHWQVNRRFTDLPADSRYASKDWRWRASTSRNDRGELLNHQFRISRQSRLRDGSVEYGQLNVNSAGRDDLITRGNGAVNLPPSFNSFFEYTRPRKGDWSQHAEAEVFSGGLLGNRRIGYSLTLEPTYHVSDSLDVTIGVLGRRRPGWLVWQESNLLGTFDGRRLALDAGLNWAIGPKQELRAKLEAIAITARLQQAYRVQPNGEARATADPVDDFNVRTLGFQVRYRYELAPLSYLYVVYGRGGFADGAVAGSTARTFGDAFELRDDEQFLLKVSYRFEK